MVGLHWYMDMLQVKFDVGLNSFIEPRLILNNISFVS